MLAFVAEFPVKRERQSVEFFASISKWVLRSPHTAFSIGDIEQALLEAEWKIKKGNESLDLLRCSVGRFDSAAVRYVRIDNGLQWTTNAVFSAESNDAWVAIRVECESLHPAVRLPVAKKPVLLRILLDELGGGHDGPLLVSDSAVRLSPLDVALAAGLIRGNSSCRLPIVYVSANFHGTYILDPDRLARDFAGLAHVVVEPDRHFSLRLKLEVSSGNVYGGTIGIYWPDGGGRRAFFIGGEYDTPGEIVKALSVEINGALINRRPLYRCTWASVQEQASRVAFDFLRKSGSQEVEKYVEQFDREIAAKGKKLLDAEREIQRLRNDLAVFEARQATVGNVSFSTGPEQELYPNEILTFLRDALEESISRVPSDSRRQHVLQAVVNAAPQYSEAALRREKLKDILRDFRRLNKNNRRELEALGFDILEEGKHVKIRFQGDDRYSFTLPKSGSDHRGGLNAASDIGKLLF